MPADKQSKLSTYYWKQIRKQVLSRDGHTCTWCGNSEGKMEVDHILPRVQGGDDTLGNLQTLCQACHINKTKKDSVFLHRKSTHPIPSSFSLQKARIGQGKSDTRVVDGDQAFEGLIDG